MLPLKFTPLLLTLVFLPPALANVEKVIFVPNYIPPSDSRPLRLSHTYTPFRLTPDKPRLLTTLDLGGKLNNTSDGRDGYGAEYGNGYEDGKGREESSTWVLLEKLTPGKRYEVRIVWAATEPAEFELGVFTGMEAEEAGALEAGGGGIRRGEGSVKEKEDEELELSSSETEMWLRVLAKKDQWNPDPVTVELILDPFLLNILPESLLYIAGVIVLVAGAAWGISGVVYTWLAMIASQHRAVGLKKVE